MRPCDIYSGTKAEAEEIVQSSSLEWVVLRFGGVLTTNLSALPLSGDAMLFESALPSDNRVQTVDVRDVAWACAAATTADVAGEILLIAGDDSHRHCYGDLAPALVSALGIPGAIPPGRPGDPDSDKDWFVTDWMDTTRAQEALQFQHYSWSGPDGRVLGEVLVYPVLGSTARAGRSRGDEAPVGLLERTGPIRRPVGRDWRQIGRPVVGSTVGPALNA